MCLYHSFDGFTFNYSLKLLLHNILEEAKLTFFAAGVEHLPLPLFINVNEAAAKVVTLLVLVADIKELHLRH
jgi:hypothetical protein